LVINYKKSSYFEELIEIFVDFFFLLRESMSANTSHNANKLQGSGLMQIQRRSLVRQCKLVEAQMSLMLILSMDFQGHCITALPKVKYFS
jgi:hypothetical protein